MKCMLIYLDFIIQRKRPSIINVLYSGCSCRSSPLLLCMFVQEVKCLRLLKKFSPKHFEPKSSRQGCDELDAEQTTKSGKRGRITDQLVELPIEHQIYDMIDAEGSKGLTYTEVRGFLSGKALNTSMLCAMLFPSCMSHAFEQFSCS